MPLACISARIWSVPFTGEPLPAPVDDKDTAREPLLLDPRDVAALAAELDRLQQSREVTPEERRLAIQQKLQAQRAEQRAEQLRRNGSKGIGAAGTDVPEGIRDDCDFVSEDSFGREICLDGFVVSKRKAKAGR